MIKSFKKILSQHYSTTHQKIHKPMVDYNQRGQYRSPLSLKVGDIIDNFQVTHACKFPDFQIDSVSMKCKKHGIEWVHFDCQQQINTLALIIKCKQAPNIIKMGLQKLLQCGSHKYPITNPIQFMNKRSFNPQNFTYSTQDYLFYGYQTSLLQDHANLMSVFVNMMFNSLLRQQDFTQNIWRYNLNDNGKLSIVGDLANQLFQMNFSSQMRIYDAIEKMLHKRSGIMRRDQIIQLTYANIVKWYQKLFVPSNLLIMSHGDLHPIKLIKNFRKETQTFKWKESKPITSNQKKSNESVLTKNQQNQEQSSKTIKIEHFDPPVPLVLSFKLNDVSHTERILLAMLSYILFDMPDAPFMRWNTPKTPYPKHYGFQGSHFNIAISFQQTQKLKSDHQFLQQQKHIWQLLRKLSHEHIPNVLIQQCLFHLQSEYYTKDGIKMITGYLNNYIQYGPSSLQQSFNVKYFISKLIKNYRKDLIFQRLIQKFILNNQHYLRIWGKVSYDLLEDTKFQQNVKLNLLLSKIPSQQLQQLKNYKQPTLLQDYRILPNININQYEIFQQKNPTILSINGITIHHAHKCDGIRINIKYDVTDLQEQQIKVIPVLCQTFPWMGSKGITAEALKNYLSFYIRSINMKFQTIRTELGMRLYLILSIEFSDRNSEYGFNFFINLINDHHSNNIESLSQRLHKKASQTYNDLTSNLIEIHGRHIGGTRSPYALMEDPIYMSRSLCNVAASVLKVSNPKKILEEVTYEMRKISQKFRQKHRITVLFQCHRQKLSKYQKYLQIMLNSLKQSTQLIQPIYDKSFTPKPCMKYFPNYNDQYIFEAFTVPFYNNVEQIPATLLLSSIVNQNIKTFNSSGGCFVFKGSMIAYLRGNRKKIFELQKHYRNIEDLDQAKRYIFQKFRRYTAIDQFFTGATAEQSRQFKQAVAMVDEQSVQACLQKYILPSIKSETSSILALGPHLGNYQPLIKKGWVTERSIDEMALKMEANLVCTPQISMSKYINIY